MREILFRGKSGSLCWATGNLNVFDGKYFIEQDCLTRFYILDPKTIGQYIGIKDKNGKKIFEGDVLQEGRRLIFVTWNEKKLEVEFKSKGILYKPIIAKTAMVIGNIHDTPKLLGQEEQEEV